MSDSEEEENLDIETEELKAYIIIGTDIDGDNFVAVQFAKGCHKELAGLMFLLMTGSTIEECVRSLRHACENEMEAQMVLQMLATQVKQHAAKQQQVQIKEPVVDPTEVFNRKESNDYKG